MNIFVFSVLWTLKGVTFIGLPYFLPYMLKKRPYFKGKLALVIFQLSWTVVLEKTLESPLDCKQIKADPTKGYQPWIFIGKTDAEAPVRWPPDEKSQCIRKDPDAGKDWRQEEKGMTEDEMVGWHHRIDGHEFEQAPGVGEGQGGLAYCSPWDHK